MKNIQHAVFFRCQQSLFGTRKQIQYLFQSASGTGLAFILFTEAVNQFPGGNAWAVLFFLMLFTLGLDSQFGTLQGVIQCVIDLK